MRFSNSDICSPPAILLFAVATSMPQSAAPVGGRFLLTPTAKGVPYIADRNRYTLIPNIKKDTPCVLTVPVKLCLATVSQIRSIKSIELYWTGHSKQVTGAALIATV